MNTKQYLRVHQFGKRGEFVSTFTINAYGGKSKIVVDYSRTVHIDGRIFYEGSLISPAKKHMGVILMEMTNRGQLPPCVCGCHKVRT